MNDSTVELRSGEPRDLRPEPAAGTGASVEALLADIDGMMHRVGRLMASRHAEFQQASGIPTHHFMMLKAIACEGPLRVSEVAQLLGVKNPAASMLVQQLESEGLIERRHDDADNRVVMVSMTATGAERLAHAEVYRRAFLRRITSRLAPEDLEALVRVLDAMCASMTADADTA